MNKFVFTLTVLLSLSVIGFSQDKVKIDADQSYLVLSTKRIQTMEKELDEVAAKGFRVLYGAPTQQFDMSILLERVPDPVSEPYRYKVLATSRLKTMEKELNDLAKQGYQLLPRTIIFKQGFVTAELVMQNPQGNRPSRAERFSARDNDRTRRKCRGIGKESKIKLIKKIFQTKKTANICRLFCLKFKIDFRLSPT